MEDEFYNSFYVSPTDSIQIVQLLMDDSCDKCLGVSQSSYSLSTPGVLTPEELIPILRCQTKNGFRPISLLRFVIEMESEQIGTFLDDKQQTSSQFLQEVSYTNPVSFPETVRALQAASTLFILYRRKTSKTGKATNKPRQTRVIRIGHSSVASASRMHSKKTRRKNVSFG